MNVKYLDKNGKSQTAIMGCYGIGVGRALASVCEQSNDKWGPVWPLAITPFQLHIVALNMKKSDVVKEKADELYEKLTAAGIEVIYDDRDVKASLLLMMLILLGFLTELLFLLKLLTKTVLSLKLVMVKLKK